MKKLTCWTCGKLLNVYDMSIIQLGLVSFGIKRDSDYVCAGSHEGGVRDLTYARHNNSEFYLGTRVVLAAETERAWAELFGAPHPFGGRLGSIVEIRIGVQTTPEYPSFRTFVKARVEWDRMPTDARKADLIRVYDLEQLTPLVR